MGVGLSSDYQTLGRDLSLNGQPLDLDDPQIDAEIFERGMKKQFGDLKRNFRDVVDNIRTNEMDTFRNINIPKAKQNQQEGAYNKLEAELSKLKQQIDKANQAKALFDDFFSDIKKQVVQQSPAKAPNVKNHIDAKTNFNSKRQELSDDDLLSDEDDVDGDKINFDELFKKSNILHSR